MRNKILAALCVLFLLPLAAGQARAEKGTLPPMPDTKITVPWDDFVRMMEGLASHPAPPVPPPPTDLAVGRASYTMRIVPGRLETAVTLDVRSYGDGWHEIFVAGRDTPLISLTVDGIDAVTLVKDDGVWAALPGEGKRTIRALLVTEAPDTPGPHTVAIPGPTAAAREIDLSYPRNYTDVGVGGVVTASMPGRLSAVLAGGGSIEVSYTVAAVEKIETTGKKATGPPVVTAQLFTAMDIEEEAILLSVRIDYEVKNGPVRSFRVSLPQGFDLLDVKGDGIASWETSQDRTGLTAAIGYDVSGPYSLFLSFEKAMSDELGSIEFPRVVPAGAERSTGYVTVVSGGGFEVTELKSKLLTPRDPTELPEGVFSLSALPPILAYRFTDPRYSLTVGIRKGEALSALSGFADSANSVILVTADGKMVVRTNYFVRNRNLQFLTIVLPPESVLWSATTNGVPTKPSTDKKGVVLVPLPMGSGGADGPSVVSVVIFVPTPTLGWAGRLFLPLPRLEIPTGQVMATFYLPEGMSYLSFGGDMEQIKYFTELLSPGSSESFVEENLRLRKSVYERQEDLENVINEQQQMPDKGGAGLPPAPEGFDLPLSGKVYRFVKLITMGEETSVVATYVDLRLLVAGILLLLIVVGGGALRYRRKLRSIVTGRTGDRDIR